MEPTATISWQGTNEADSADQGDTGVIVFMVAGAPTTDTVTASQRAKALIADQFGTYVGSSYGGLSPLVCRSMIPRAISPMLMEVIANFDVPPCGGYTATTSPLLLDWRYEWRDCTEDVPFDRDVDNNPVLNSAGNSPAQPPTKTITKEILRIHRNEAFYDRATYKTYKNTVNSDTIVLTEPNGNENTFPPGTLKCVSIEPEKEYTLTDSFVPIVLTFEAYDLSEISIDQPFQLHLLDEGVSGWVTGDDGPKPANFTWVNSADGTYVPASDPVLLDGTGLPLARPSVTNETVYVGEDGRAPIANPAGTPAGATLEYAQDNAAVYLRWNRYKSVPFLPILTQVAAG